jgi:Gpi18-like mannosyltransferase
MPLQASIFASGIKIMLNFDNYTAHIWGVPFIILCIAAFLIFSLLLLLAAEKTYSFSGILKKCKIKFRHIIIIAFAAAFLMRFAFTFIFEGHQDISYFRYWTDILLKNPLNFYDDVEQNNYLPLYLYVLLLQGGAFSLFNVSIYTAAFYIWLKIPLIICDLLTAYFIYKILKGFTSEKFAFLFCLAYLFNPATILLSSFWGQVDCITALLTVLCIYFFMRKKYIGGFIITAVAMSFKLQFAFILPVLGVYVLLNIIKYVKEKNYAKLKQIIYGIVICIGVYAALVLPLTFKYIKSGDYSVIFDVYFSGQVNLYNYYTVNAFNIYGAMQKNWIQLPQSFLGLFSYDMFNYIIIALICLISAILFIISKSKKTLYMLSSFIIIAVFTFSTKMHERYMFAALAPLLIAAVIYKDKRLYACFIMFTLLQLLNSGVLLFKIPRDRHYGYGGDTFFVVCSVIWMLQFAYFAYTVISVCIKSGKTARENDIYG